MFQFFRRRPPAPTVAEPQNAADRRRDVHVCAGCLVWSSKLVYMSNGLDYCVNCAKKLSRHPFGLKVAGKRDEDIKVLEVAEDQGPHGFLPETAPLPTEHRRVVFVRRVNDDDEM